MAAQEVNGVRLSYQLTGTGDIPLVLVHGSWGSHRGWDRVVPGLAESFRVLCYDRRGHGESESSSGQGSIREDVGDLASLIDSLGLDPAYVAGNSLGASITLRLAGARPELLRGVIGHEPPLFLLLAADPEAAPILERTGRAIAAVVERIGSGDAAGAAELFVETVAFKPGSWAEFRPEVRQMFVENAATFVDEVKDPEQLAFDLNWIQDFARPVLLTKGEQSPATYAPVIAKLVEALPSAETLTFPGADHFPHDTHPAAYIEATTAFIRKHEA